MTQSPRQALRLGPLDAAIILREDGMMEASMPEITTETVPDNVITAAAVLFALRNPRLCDLIRDNFVSECGQLNLHSANDDKTSGSL